MATVTGMTATRMLAIEAATIVSGAYDSTGHLILTKHDGSLTDAGLMPAATSTAKGIVELATNAETLAGTDTGRAITPAGLASIPGNKVQVLASTSIVETALPSAYPAGVSLMTLSGSAWSVNSGYGSVVTNNTETDRCVQMFYNNAGGIGYSRAWMREYHTTNGGGGWTAWSEQQLMVTLTPGSYTQTTPLSSYPSGHSRLYYTSATSTAWDFTGLYGEVITYVNGSDFARQTFISHSNGTGKPVMWFRTANASGGWTAWQTVVTDQGAWTPYLPVWTAATTNPSVNNGTLVGRYTKVHRVVNYDITLTAGPLTNYGSGNYSFLLPFAAASFGQDFIGNVQLLGADRWAGQFVIASGSTTGSPFLPATSSNNRLEWYGGSTAPAENFASGSKLRITGMYESAT